MTGSQSAWVDRVLHAVEVREVVQDGVRSGCGEVDAAEAAGGDTDGSGAGRAGGGDVARGVAQDDHVVDLVAFLGGPAPGEADELGAVAVVVAEPAATPAHLVGEPGGLELEERDLAGVAGENGLDEPGTTVDPRQGSRHSWQDACAGAQLVEPRAVFPCERGGHAVHRVGIRGEIVQAQGLIDDVQLGAAVHGGEFPQRNAGDLGKDRFVDLASDAAGLDERAVDVPQDESGALVRHGAVWHAGLWEARHRRAEGGGMSADEELARRLGERLRYRRLAAGKTQPVIAGLAGITVDYLYQLERGKKVPALPVMLALAGALRVPAAVLLGEYEEPAAGAVADGEALHRGTLITDETVEALAD